MNYTTIDPTISAWATEHNLTIYKSYRDEEVRSTEIIGAKNKCQIWIDLPDQSGMVTVHVWDYKNRKQDYTIKADDLKICLEQAYETASKWVESSI